MSRPTRFAHYVSITAGVLVVALCGLCTFDVLKGPEAAIAGPFALVIGGAPILAGIWLIVHSVRGLMAGGDK